MGGPHKPWLHWILWALASYWSSQTYLLRVGKAKPGINQVTKKEPCTHVKWKTGRVRSVAANDEPHKARRNHGNCNRELRASPGNDRMLLFTLQWIWGLEFWKISMAGNHPPAELSGLWLLFCSPSAGSFWGQRSAFLCWIFREGPLDPGGELEDQLVPMPCFIWRTPHLEGEVDRPRSPKPSNKFI